MSDEARKRRAETWARFADEDGGLYDMLDRLRDEAVETVQASTPGPIRDGAVALLQAVEKLRGEVRAIVNTAVVDVAEQQAAAEIALGKRKAFH